jgi:hypothetical protein
MYHQYPKREIETVKNWISASFRILIQKDRDLLMPESIPTVHKIEGQKDLNRELHETAINHRLAVHLECLMEKFGITGYHVDIEYNRFINNRKLVRSLRTGEFIEVRPDIIVHKRIKMDEATPHILVVEAKKHELNDKDRNHIEDIMKDDNYRYKYGLLVSYYDKPAAIQSTLLILRESGFVEYAVIVAK